MTIRVRVRVNVFQGKIISVKSIFLLVKTKEELYSFDFEELINDFGGALGLFRSGGSLELHLSVTQSVSLSHLFLKNESNKWYFIIV